MKLSEEQRQSLITSLLGFVRRVSFHGAGSPEEAEILPILVSLLLGEPWLFNSEGSPAFEREEDAESDCAQESENSGYACECRCACGRV